VELSLRSLLNRLFHGSYLEIGSNIFAAIEDAFAARTGACIFPLGDARGNQAMTMNKLMILAVLLPSAIAAYAQLSSKITHYDVSQTVTFKAAHGGVGTMAFSPLMTDKTLFTNLLFLHCGGLHPHSGIGEHFHNHCEEMFVILNSEAEFTINGRASLLKDPVGAPDRMGSAHAIYNPTEHMWNG
jgi:mannose-6-phosphate isomerase-like protein (cupin superfamily)